MVFGTVIRFARVRPKINSGSLKFLSGEKQNVTRTLFGIVKNHGPISIADAWSRVQETGVKELCSKRKMKKVLQWMKERAKIKLHCNHVDSQKQFVYTAFPEIVRRRAAKRPKVSSGSNQPKDSSGS